MRNSDNRPNKPSPDELIAKSRVLAKNFSEIAVETENNRRVTDDSIRSMIDSDLLRILQPVQFGGLEYGVEVFMDCVFELARGCGSTGWVYANLGVHQWLTAIFSQQAQEDVWGADKNAVATGSYAPIIQAKTVDGGFVLDGMWPFVSGSVNAQWALLGATVADGQKGPSLFLVPASDYRIDDMWYAAGLCGTASNDIYLDEVFVPDHRVVRFHDLNIGCTPGSEVHSNRLFSTPFLSLVPYGIATTSQGMLQNAIDATVDLLKVRSTRGGTSGGGRRVADFPHVQSRLAEASVCLDAARLLLRRDAIETQNSLRQSNEPLSVDQRILNRRNHGMSMKLMVQGINALFDNVGGAGLTQEHSIQRCWRDINCAARHAGLNWDIQSTLYGQHMLGLDPKGGY